MSAAALTMERLHFGYGKTSVLSNLDLTTIGTRPEKSDDTMTKRSTHLRIVK